MLLEPGGTRLTGVSTSNRDDHGQLTWVDDVEVPEPTEYWRLGHDARDSHDRFQLENLTGDTPTIPFEVRPDGRTNVADLAIGGELTTPLRLGASHTQLGTFDTNDEHWLHAGETAGDDQILGIERVATDAYRLHLSEGDETNAILTTGDEGSLNAGTLDGLDSSAYLHADGSVPLGGPLWVGTNTLSGPAGTLTIGSDGSQSTLSTGGGGSEGWTVWDSSLSATHTSFAEGGDLHVHEGTIRQQGTAVATINDVGVDVENIDGTTLRANATAIQAGTDLTFNDDGDDTVTLSFTGGSDPTSAAVGDTATTSGDGSTTTFSLAHSLGAVPDAVSVEAASEAASTDFWVSNVTDSAVEVTYPTAPPSGTDNLSWHIETTASGLDAVTISNDGATLLANPDDFNYGDGLAASDDGDGTFTAAVDSSVARRTASETVTAYWQFDGGVGVGEGSDLAFADASETTQFGFAYDETNDRHVFADRANATDIWHTDRSGVVDFQQRPTVDGTQVATTDQDLANSGSGSAPAEAVPEADGDGNIVWNKRSDASELTESGDGETTTFTLAHDLGTTPTGAYPIAESPAAMSDFHVSNKTASDVVITYANAPPSGTDNLEYNLIVHE